MPFLVIPRSLLRGGFIGSQRRAFGARLGLQAMSVFLRKPLRVGQQGTDFLPHRQVQQVGPHLRILANALAPKAVGVTACNRNGPGLQSARFSAHITCL